MMADTDPIWLTVARNQIGLAEIPGPRHNSTILNWLKELKAWWMEDETPWCFTGDTEILTEDGWVRLDQLDETRQVFQADATGRLSLTPIIKKIEKDYNDEVFEIAHQSIRLICDREHRWWGMFEQGELRFGTLGEIGKTGLCIPAVFSGAGDCGLSGTGLKLLASYVASETAVRSTTQSKNLKDQLQLIDFQVTEQYEYDMMDVIWKSFGFARNSLMDGGFFQFRYPEVFDKCLSGHKQLSRQFINSLSQSNAREFLQAFVMFTNGIDNTVPNIAVLNVTDKQRFQDLLAIATLAGYHAHVHSYTKDGDDGMVTYCIVIHLQQKMRVFHQHDLIRKVYEGRLYCVQVPEGRIVVRGPNSAPIVAGNCGTYVAHCLKSTGYEIPKYWMRAKDWAAWGKSVEKPTLGCVVVFERKGGGHVGFVVGTAENGDLMVLGGNQGNKVSVAPFDPSRAIAFRVPKDFVAGLDDLPVLASNGMPRSTNEA